ncbi:succinylglutamate desuccinylase/aspartoacylase family protein [Aquibaculum sediminis]|uniref:succinylglutamate desuccinylase/aspartoacylase family protein n=1 Tax=Aquibaculum sediminis TaxID=3231907 RepID=UPI00345608A3
MTTIHCEVDLERPGRQVGFLRLPYSVDRSAYGWLPIPIAVVGQGERPTVLLLAGVHGDEFEGQVVLSELIRLLQPEEVQGRLIILPMANFPAAKAGRRVSPLDEVNLNRAFPGAAEGTPTRQIADYIEHHLIPRADLVLDLHSGGGSLEYVPTVLLDWDQAPAARARDEELARSFGAPFACWFGGGHGGSSCAAASARQGVRNLTTEMGGAGRVSPEALAICRRGVRNVLAQLGVMAGQPVETPAQETRVVWANDPAVFVWAPEPGLFEPLWELGSRVEAGALAGWLHPVETPWREAVPVYFDTDGYVLCKRIPGRAERGDCLFHLGRETPPEAG